MPVVVRIVQEPSDDENPESIDKPLASDKADAKTYESKWTETEDTFECCVCKETSAFTPRFLCLQCSPNKISDESLETPIFDTSQQQDPSPKVLKWLSGEVLCIPEKVSKDNKLTLLCNL